MTRRLGINNLSLAGAFDIDQNGPVRSAEKHRMGRIHNQVCHPISKLSVDQGFDRRPDGISVPPDGHVLLLDENFGHQDHSFQTENGHAHNGPQFVDPAQMVKALTEVGFVEIDAQHTVIGGQPSWLTTARRRDPV